MAKIVLGLGTSHTPMLLASDETLPRFEETDQKIKHRDKEGRPATYAELLEKADPKMAAMVAPADWSRGRTKCAPRWRTSSKTLDGAKLDALIVMSDDQDEAYLEDAGRLSPSITAKPSSTATSSTSSTISDFPEWYVKNRQGFFEEQSRAPIRSTPSSRCISSTG